MSNYSGFSQLSNLSNISSTSRSASMRCPLKADLSIECSNRFTKASTDLKKSANQLEEVNKAFSQCEDVIYNYAIKKLMYECVIDASLNVDKTLPESTAKKLKQLLAVHEVGKYLHLPNNLNNVNERLTLLGITDLPRVEFSYEEKLDAKRSIENKLQTKIKAFLSRYENLGGNLEELMKKNESAEYKQISEVFQTDSLNWREKILEECAKYEKDILEYKSLFNDWVNLKHGDMNDIEHKKAESLLVQVQVSEVQAKITKLSCILKMFQATPITLDAYKIVNSNLDSEISKLDEEILKKEATLKLYEDLAGTEYDQIARRYQEICEAIEKAKYCTEN